LAPAVVLQERPLHLTLRGKYQSIGEFLGVLAEAPFVSVVRSLVIVKPEAGSLELQADVGLGVFWMKEGS